MKFPTGSRQIDYLGVINYYFSVEKIFNATFGCCCATKNKTVTVLDIDGQNNREVWNVNDMSIKSNISSFFQKVI